MLLKRPNVMNCLQTLIILVLLILVIQLKKTDYKAKINEIENKITSDYHKCITTQEFNKLTSENFAAGLAQANLGSKADIPDVTYFEKKKKKTDFEDKLKKNKR